MTKLTIKNALTKAGVTDKENQDAFLTAFEGKSLAEVSEEDVVKELENIGITDKEKLKGFFAAVEKSEILDQELDIEELEAVSGGNCNLKDQEKDQNCCVKDHYRTFWKDGCAATVKISKNCSIDNLEPDGYCANNDACAIWAVRYTDLGSYLKDTM